MQKFADWTDQDESQKLRYAMQRYRLETQAYMDVMTSQIKEKEERIHYIEAVEVTSDKWQRLSQEIEDPQARRRLFMYLLERIVVTKDGSADIVARVKD